MTACSTSTWKSEGRDPYQDTSASTSLPGRATQSWENCSVRDLGDTRKILQPSQVTPVHPKVPDVTHVLDVRYQAEERKVIREYLNMRTVV